MKTKTIVTGTPILFVAAGEAYLTVGEVGGKTGAESARAGSTRRNMNNQT
jgi:hypothetical protein